MIINNLDLGAHTTWLLPFATNAGPEINQTIGSSLLEGVGEVPFQRGAQLTTRTEDVYLTASSAIGGAAGGSQQAAQYLYVQLLELANNPQPCYIQWASGGGVIVTDPQDGWYMIQKVKPDNEFVWTGIVKVTLTVTQILLTTTRIGMAISGAALSSNYTGTATNWVSFPVGSTSLLSSVTRTGGEGAVPLAVSPLINPAPVVLSSTVSNTFLGDCKVFDVNAAIATNPVPTDGTFKHANWVEVKDTDHRFVGDVAITNGLHLYTFSPGGSPGIALYLWNTALSSAAWQKWADFFNQDNTLTQGTVRQITLLRAGFEEVGVRIVESTVNGGVYEITFRLQRGTYTGRIDVRPLTENRINVSALYLNFPAAFKILYTSSAIFDPPVQYPGPQLLPATTDYGYTAAFINSTTYPFLAGLMYQNRPDFQSWINSTTGMTISDVSGLPAQGTSASYGIFAFPFGTQTTTTDKLQADAANGTLSGGVVSVVAAGTSSGNAAKVPSGTGGQIPAPNALSGMTDTGAGAGTLNKGGYTVTQTWTDASGETTASSDGFTSPLSPASIQKGAVTYASGVTSIAPTISASTAGTCLVAVIGAMNGVSPANASGPANWSRLTRTTTGGFLDHEVWVYLNNPGGITTGTWTFSLSDAHAEISEWSNVSLVSVLETSGTNSSTSGTTLTVTSGATLAQSNDVAIASWVQYYGNTSNTATFTTPSGWTRVADDGSTSAKEHLDAEYKLNPTTGVTLSATLTSSLTTYFGAGSIICLKPAPSNTVFLTANGDKLHVPIIAAPATTTNGKFYFETGAVPSGINAGLAATQAVSAGNVAAFDITANPGNTTQPPTSNTTAGTTAIDLFGTAWIPPAGVYDLWMRLRVTSAAGANFEMKFGLWDATSAAYVVSTTWAPNSFTTLYVWYRVATNVTPTSGHNMQYRFNTNATTGTDWFIDEAVLLPRNSLTSYSFPRDLWQQWMYDRTTKLVFG